MNTKLNYNFIFLVYIIIYFFIQVIIINSYNNLIFDEIWYVNAARTFLNSGIYERPEHPPLAQIFIAINIFIFGDKPLGWRLFSVIFSCATLYIIYVLVKNKTQDPDLAFASILVLSSCKLFFTFSILSVLDISMMFFFVTSIFLILKEKWIESSIVMAISSICKLTSIFYIPLIVSYIIIKRRKYEYNKSYKLFLKIVLWIIIFITIFTSLMLILDLLFIEFKIPSISNSFNHLSYMFNVHTSSNWPTNISEKPWLWLIYQNNYYLGNISMIKNNYLEATSLLITGLPLITLPYGLYKKDSFSTISSIWFINTYLIWFLAYFLLERPIFNFYLLPALPAISILNCLFFNENKKVLWFYVLLCLIFFIFFQFPIEII